MEAPKLVPNPGTVLLTATSLYPAYTLLALDVGTKVLEYINEHREVKWQDAIIPILLILIPAFRVIQQQALANATERRLAQEKIVREELEQIATSAGPPITTDQVKAIKRDAAAAVGKQ